MSVIRLSGFGGESPRILPRLLQGNQAQAAFNVRLDDGGLTPVHKAVQHDSVTINNPKVIYKHGATWLSWGSHVDICEGAVSQDRLYYTGDGVPKMRLGNDVYPLLVPRPQNSLTKTIASDANPPVSGQVDKRDVITRHYVYTYVTQFGEESEPCPLGNSIDWKAGQTIKLAGFLFPPSGRAIIRQRIYRSQTSASATGFYFIAERSASSGDFMDDVPVDGFNEPIPSLNWHAPPDDLAGLTAMPNGMMAAFRGKELYFCELFHPHAWPQQYILTTDSEIVALGSIGSMLVILTRAQPYLAQGSEPQSMQMVKMEANYPCINHQGVVDMGFSIVYPSNEGLVAIDAGAAVNLISGNIFNRDDWLALNPQTMIGAQHQGRYIAFYEHEVKGEINRAMLILSPIEQPFLLRCDEAASAAFYDVPTGGLFFVRHGEKDILRFDDPQGEHHLMYWKSRPFYFSKPENFGCILIENDKAHFKVAESSKQSQIDAVIAGNETKLAAGSVLGAMNEAEINFTALNGDILDDLSPLEEPFHVCLIADDVRVWQGSTTNRILRLPSGFLARKWEVEVSGSVPIEQITIARTIDELKRVAG